MSTAYGYDRITLWLDCPDLPIALKTLKRHCKEVCVTHRQMPYKPTCQIKISLHQPSLQCLEVLARELCHGTPILLTYVEIAQDILALNATDSAQWKAAFLASARVHYQRQKVRQSKDGGESGAHYFGRHQDRNRLAIYADNPSKLNVPAAKGNYHPCLHIEWRAGGSLALQALGIVSVEDLIRFDHKAFWESHLCLYHLPRPTELGRMLARAANGSEEVGSAAFRKRARNWEARYCDAHGNFILHSAVLGNPYLLRQLAPMTVDEWKRTLKVTAASALDYTSE